MPTTGSRKEEHLKLWQRLKRIWTMPGKDQDMPYSIVLLLRTRRMFSQEELQTASERGWDRSFDGQADPMYFVVQKKAITMIKVGAHLLTLLHANQTYLGDPEEVCKQLPREEQRKAWLDHQAWVSLDFLNLELPKAEAYETLARLAEQLVDGNCSAVCLPEEQIVMPNDGTAEEGLRFIIARQLF